MGSSVKGDCRDQFEGFRDSRPQTRFLATVRGHISRNALFRAES